MDNLKLGGFIKELRREKRLTQAQLAEKLHITDRAVSKWERGLSAPDISLLEPLADALGVSVAELLSGSRIENTEDDDSASSTKAVLEYSKKQIIHQRKKSRKLTLAAAFLLLAALIAIGVIIMKTGIFFITGRAVSPDGEKCVTVYSRELMGDGFSFVPATSLITDLGNEAEWRVNYGDCVCRGIWWSPDSTKYVTVLEYDDEERMSLSWLERNSSSNLTAYLSMGVETSELNKYGYAENDMWPEIDYDFLMWSDDSTSLLIRYSFLDKQGSEQDGYFWYNCENAEVSGVLEM